MTASSVASRLDRLFMTTLGLSLAGHVVVLGAQLMTLRVGGFSRPMRPTKIIYEPETTRDLSRWTKEFGRIQVRLGAVSAPSSASSASASSLVNGYKPGTIGADALDEAAQAQMGGGAGQGWSSALASQSGSDWKEAVDLTNLTAASQGSPVLYSYFSAIREQIQQTANQHAWLRRETVNTGVVHVGFVLNRTGAIQSVGIVSERSVASTALQEVALRIIKASGPFLPFPPSFEEPTKAIIVPLEFSPAS